MDATELDLLHQELATDPLSRGYAAMTNAEAADDLNAIYRTRNRGGVSGDEAFEATATAEFGALTAEKRQLWMAWCGRSSIDPFGTANIAFVKWVFGAGSETLSALADLRVEDVSRAAEIGLPIVSAEDVDKARSNF